MQIEDREETIIRVEEQLKESAKNQASVLADLKEVFSRLERDSKVSMTISGDLKGHLETSKFRWDTFNKRLDDGDVLFKELSREISKEKEDRVQFEQEVKTSLKTIRWVFGTLATLAAALSTIMGIIQFKQ